MSHLCFSAEKLYKNKKFIEERHRHRYEVGVIGCGYMAFPLDCSFNFAMQVNFNMVESFENKGLSFVGHDEEGKRMEVVELAGTDHLCHRVCRELLLAGFQFLRPSLLCRGAVSSRVSHTAHGSLPAIPRPCPCLHWQITGKPCLCVCHTSDQAHFLHA